MAAAGPGAGALGPMAAAEPVAEALGAQHVGRRVSVFYDKPAPGASFLARLLHYDSVSDEFGVQWVNEHGGQLEGSASEWMDLGEGVALVPDSGTPTRPFLQRMQKQEDDGAFKWKSAQYDAGPTGKKIQPVQVYQAEGNREDADAVLASASMINGAYAYKKKVVRPVRYTNSRRPEAQAKLRGLEVKEAGQ